MAERILVPCVFAQGRPIMFFRSVLLARKQSGYLTSVRIFLLSLVPALPQRTESGPLVQPDTLDDDLARIRRERLGPGQNVARLESMKSNGEVCQEI